MDGFRLCAGEIIYTSRISSLASNPVPFNRADTILDNIIIRNAKNCPDTKKRIAGMRPDEATKVQLNLAAGHPKAWGAATTELVWGARYLRRREMWLVLLEGLDLLRGTYGYVL